MGATTGFGERQEAQGADTGAGTGAGAVNDTRKSGRAASPNGIIEVQTAPWNGQNSAASHCKCSIPGVATPYDGSLVQKCQ
jgi:hypothetical protein